MVNTFQIKADVVNELRNQIYYGQLEVQRLLGSPAGLTHKKIVDKIALQLKKNVIANEAINLIEAYLPTTKTASEQPSQVQEAVPVDEESIGIKKID